MSDKIVNFNKDQNRGPKQARKASEVEPVLCDDFKGVLDQSKEYTTEEMIAIFELNSEWNWENLIRWIFTQADWRNKDMEKQNKVIDVLNDFLKVFNAGAAQGESDPNEKESIDSLDEDSMEYFKGKFTNIDENQEKILLKILSQMLCDI